MVEGGPSSHQVTSSLCLGNTNSQFYMWEPADPFERADFEEDLIASTNEKLYQSPLIGMRQKGFVDDRENFF